jgi:hypothetical protein
MSAKPRTITAIAAIAAFAAFAAFALQLSVLALLALVAACGDARRATPPPPPSPSAGLAAPVTIPCGPAKTCDARAAYCETIQTDVPALPSTYTCKPLPATCTPGATPASCDCFPHPTRCGFCRAFATPAPTLTGFNRVCVGGA